MALVTLTTQVSESDMLAIIVNCHTKMYSENSHCEWLIQPSVQNSSHMHYISLQFSRMATECSYDYLYVYDGNNYKSRLLGSFSGRV